jgi:ribosomal protein L40E
MFFLFGDKSDTQHLGQVDVPCPDCGWAPCDLFAIKSRFTVYFIPTFTTSSRFVMRCGHCQGSYSVDQATGEQLRGRVRQTATKPSPPAGATASPGAVSSPAQSGSSPGIRCKGCGASLPAGARFCLQCGAPTTAAPAVSHTCPACGSQQFQGAYCARCGARLP